MSDSPAAPEGALLPALAPPGRRDELRLAARGWPHGTLTPIQAAHAELLLTGAFSPLRGFLRRTDAEASASRARLSGGSVWPVPILLEISGQLATQLGPDVPLVLRDAEGRAVAIQHADDVWEADGVWRVGGRLEGLELPSRYDFLDRRLPPEAVRGELTSRGWQAAMAVFAPAFEETVDRASVMQAAAAADAGVVVFGLDDLVAPADLTPYRRLARLVGWTSGADGAVVCVVPWAAPTDATRAVVLQAVVARNYGCTHLAVPHDEIARLSAENRALLAATGIDVVGAAPAARDPRSRSRRGATIFFTGLSGAGKSTIANALRIRLLEAGHQVSLLDGDLVRQHLSSELGFSREHRELNVRRIAFVAAEITRHGGLAVCAPIAPYESVRQQARAMVEAAGAFVLVYVDTPLEVCEARDPKGLYARARAGLVTSFTGVSDPYEVPLDPDLVVHAASGSPQDAVERVMALLRARDLLDADS